MNLQGILWRIEQHQKAIGKDKTSFNLKSKMMYIRDLALATNVEIAEILEELPWKPWKELHKQNCDRHAAGKEVVDAIIFLLDIWYQLDTDMDLEKEILDKININMERLDTGLHTDKF